MARELWLNACSHALVPPSISLRAVRISTGSTDIVRYRLNIDNDSLAFVTFSNNGRGLQLDYGACNFTAAGQPINFMSASSDQVVTPVEYARIEAHGVQKILEVVAPANLAMTRFVVRDRVTGNIGIADVVSTMPETPHLANPNQAPASKIPPAKALVNQENADFEHVSGYHSTGDDFLTATMHHDPEAEPLHGPVGSYGSVVPHQHAFCGDVFELQPGIRSLPDFRDLDPIGSIYTSSLAVPYQSLPPETGIPGVTDRIAWFGVDYYATFWISRAGRYEFKLMSDDGAKLQVDDKFLIGIDGLHTPQRAEGMIFLDAGRHTMHVPYFEGTPTGVALALWVRPPHGTWKIFDLRDFEQSHKRE